MRLIGACLSIVALAVVANVQAETIVLEAGIADDFTPPIETDASKGYRGPGAHGRPAIG